MGTKRKSIESNPYEREARKMPKQENLNGEPTLFNEELANLLKGIDEKLDEISSTEKKLPKDEWNLLLASSNLQVEALKNFASACPSFLDTRPFNKVKENYLTSQLTMERMLIENTSELYSMLIVLLSSYKDKEGIPLIKFYQSYPQRITGYVTYLKDLEAYAAQAPLFKLDDLTDKQYFFERVDKINGLFEKRWSIIAYSRRSHPYWIQNLPDFPKLAALPTLDSNKSRLEAIKNMYVSLEASFEVEVCQLYCKAQTFKSTRIEYFEYFNTASNHFKEVVKNQRANNADLKKHSKSLQHFCAILEALHKEDLKDFAQLEKSIKKLTQQKRVGAETTPIHQVDEQQINNFKNKLTEKLNTASQDKDKDKIHELKELQKLFSHQASHKIINKYKNKYEAFIKTVEQNSSNLSGDSMQIACLPKETYSEKVEELKELVEALNNLREEHYNLNRKKGFEKALNNSTESQQDMMSRIQELKEDLKDSTNPHQVLAQSIQKCRDTIEDLDRQMQAIVNAIDKARGQHDEKIEKEKNQKKGELNKQYQTIKDSYTWLKEKIKEQEMPEESYILLQIKK